MRAHACVSFSGKVGYLLELKRRAERGGGGHPAGERVNVSGRGADDVDRPVTCDSCEIISKREYPRDAGRHLAKEECLLCVKDEEIKNAINSVHAAGILRRRRTQLAPRLGKGQKRRQCIYTR